MTVTAEIDETGERVVLAGLVPAQKDLVRSIPGAKYDYRAGAWRVPLSWPAALQLRGTFRQHLELGPALREWGFREAERAAALQGLRESTEAPARPPGVLGAPWERLWPFQQVGVSFLDGAGSAILADEMGTGKTVQLSAVLKAPALVVAPKSVLPVWRQHLEDWRPELEVVVVTGSATQRRKLLAQPADVYVLNYDSLRGHSRLAGYGSLALKRCVAHGGEDPDVTPAKCEAHPKELNELELATVIFDEAHRLKDPSAKQTRAAWAVADQAEHVYAATGTPIANHPGELWSLLRLVAPKDWPARTAYVDRYCAQSWTPWGNDIVGVLPQMRPELFAAVDLRLLRRAKAEVLPDLPPKVYEVRHVELPPGQKKVYKALAKDMLAVLDSGEPLAIPHQLALHNRLVQAASATLDLEPCPGACEGVPAPPGQTEDLCGDCHGTGKVVRLAKPSVKVDALLEVLEELGDAPAVVFAESTQLIHLVVPALEKAGIACATITGAVPDQQREEAVTRFQEGRLRVLILQVQAGGEGLTLTRASHVIYLQRPHSLIARKQSEDRVHRPGQEADRVTIVDLTAVDTIEEELAVSLDVKGERLEEVVRDRDRLAALVRLQERDRKQAEKEAARAAREEDQ